MVFEGVRMDKGPNLVFEITGSFLPMAARLDVGCRMVVGGLEHVVADEEPNKPGCASIG